MIKCLLVIKKDKIMYRVGYCKINRTTGKIIYNAIQPTMIKLIMGEISNSERFDIIRDKYLKWVSFINIEETFKRNKNIIMKISLDETGGIYRELDNDKRDYFAIVDYKNHIVSMEDCSIHKYITLEEAQRILDI